jgi:hypothetical protein
MMKWSNDEEYDEYEEEKTRKFSCPPSATTIGHYADQNSLTQLSNDIATLRNMVEQAQIGTIRSEINQIIT